MVDENPAQRPSCSTLLHHPAICPDANKSRSQLRIELKREKFKNEMLIRKVKIYVEQMSKLDSPDTSSSTIQSSVTTKTAFKFSLLSKQRDGDQNSSKFPRSLSSSLI